MNQWFSKAATTALDLYVFGPTLIQTYRHLADLERWSREKIVAAQWMRVRQMAHHAYQTIPYYRTLFDERGLSPDQINTPEDYLRIPILTKDALRANLEQLVDRSGDPKRLRRSATGGSTGEPTPYYHGFAQAIVSAAVTYRNMRWAGWEFGDRIMRLWGSAFDVSRSQARRGRINNTVRNTRVIAAFDLSREAMSGYARDIAAFKPDLIVGYVDAMYLLASYLLDNDVQLGFKPKAIITSAGTLYDYQRQSIQTAFGCPVFNRYGGRELGDIAHECDEHAGLHINAGMIYVEVIRDGRPCQPGEEGELILTSLANFEMPFLRYAIGDRGIWADPDRICGCGRGLPLLAAVTGRVQDIIVMSGGRMISGAFFPHLFKEVANLRQFQVIQENERELLIKVAPLAPNQPIGLDFARAKIAQYLDPEITVNFEIVDVISPGPSGKLRPVISHVAVDIAGYQHLSA